MIGKKRFTLLAAALGALILAASCKKEEETALPSLTGSLNITGVPAYVSPQDEVTFKINRITHPEGGNIGYAYSITEGYMTTKDTLDAGEMTFTYKFCDRKNFAKDTLRTVTVSAYAFADGYYTTYSSSYPVTIVKGGVGKDASIQGIEAGTTEVIDGITYYTCTINGATWLSRNLVRENVGIPYLNCDAMLDVFGSYMTYEQAQTACPEGYVLPDDSQFLRLVLNDVYEDKLLKDIPGVAGQLMANALFNNEEMWPYWPEMNIDNKTCFSAIPAGYANIYERDGEYVGDFDGAGSYAAFWLDDTDPENPDKAFCRIIVASSNELKITSQDRKSFGASVRCVKK